MLTQLPQYFLAYTPKEQKFLSEILEPLQKFDRASYNREDLAQNFSNIRRIVVNFEEYLSIPFFWFLDSFYENSEIALKISSFHADLFFDYILNTLKGSSSRYKGMFHLLKEGIPLNDLQWETLQYECSKLRIPLKEYQLEILKFTYGLLEISPVQLLRKGKLRNSLLQSFNRPKLSSELSRFFRLLNAKWNVWPNYLYFGLELFWIRIKIPRSASLSKLINFKDNKNHILTTSWIYSVRSKENEFVGLLFLPSGNEQNLKTFINQKVKNKEILDYSLYRITSNQWSYSFSQYRSEIGWQELTESDWKRLLNVIKLKKDPRRKKIPKLTYLSPALNDQSYLDLKDHYASIELISNPRLYSYDDLSNEVLKSKEFELIQSLAKQGAILIDFFPTRLGDEYSLDSYWLKLPKLSFYQLSRFLELLPCVYIAYMEEGILLQTRLTKKMLSRIQSDMKWDTYQIIPSHQPLSRSIDMYNHEKRAWKVPLILDF
jgi:hypothetical protein